MNKTPKGSKDIYTADFAEYLSPVLQLDPKVKAIAKALSQQLLDVSGLIDNVLIYSRIDELPEELVDVLAYDMHVDWYDCSYPLKTKREILKNSVCVHKKMGTKYAIEKALGSIYPDSTIEEWFEFGGEPYTFRVVCDVTKTEVQASFREIVNSVNMYKRLSAHLESVTYQSSIHCLILTHTDCLIYRLPMTGRLKTGEYPVRNTKGVQTEILIEATPGTEHTMFHQTPTGTVPYRNTRGAQAENIIEAKAEGTGTVFCQVPTGAAVAGTLPERNTKAGTAAAGTVPGRNTVSAAAETQIDALTEAIAALHTEAAAGTIPGRNTASATGTAQIDAITASIAVMHTDIATGQINAGETPQRSTAGTTDASAITNAVEAAGINFKSRLCGSSRKL